MESTVLLPKAPTAGAIFAGKRTHLMNRDDDPPSVGPEEMAFRIEKASELIAQADRLLNQAAALLAQSEQKLRRAIAERTS